ncbi:hypothetical protein M493_08980 [Geobacillus genomosp. 3]|uniref:Uncharacterized protein n=2 Tax=Geobacillus genomosp. 3 TaxID=1921421 RepID=S5YZB4_GEOG3|nr:hypothetical protein M493_08980 [Geobacillus genomosp. 3]
MMGVSLWTIRVVEMIAVAVSAAGSIWIMRHDKKRYGVLYALSAAVGILLCLAFVFAGFYTFPVKLIPHPPIPLIEMLTVVPFFTLLGVRYSPKEWAWKLPFYFAGVQVIMTLELVALLSPLRLIEYNEQWDAWDSYTAWWLYLLLFEWIGGNIVPADARAPLAASSFRYGRWGWIIVHAVAMATVFLAGVYTGWSISSR